MRYSARVSYATPWENIITAYFFLLFPSSARSELEPEVGVCARKRVLFVDLDDIEQTRIKSYCQGEKTTKEYAELRRKRIAVRAPLNTGEFRKPIYNI